MTNMTRRDVFAWLTAMIAGLVLPGRAAAGRAIDVLAESWLEVLLPDRGAAGRLGRVYLAAFPDERDPQRLVAALQAALGLRSGKDADGDPVAEITARAREVVTRDYLAGRVVRVDGWVLSRTEARLYALAALASGESR